jgi:hypothetical protein
MPQIDLSILNQRQTPAFYADVLANRPAAGFVGRIFISTNTFAFFRDNGTSWDLIGGSGTGTVTGSGAAGQVSFWNGASSITGNNDLFWDSVNGHLGIGTNVPGTALQIDHDQNQFIRLNQTTATNDTKIAFQNSGIALWRIGNSYNAGANDFGIYDVVGSIQPVTVKKTTGQVLIGTSTVGSGKLVVASATGDNHIQIVGATSPSLRIDSAESGPTKRIGIGLATAVNNFIQNSQNLDMCIFNGSTSAAGNMLFGIYDTSLANIQEAARISSARNFLVGTTIDGGQRLQISGGARATGYYLDGMTAGSGALYWSSSTNRVTLANYNTSGIIEFEVNGGNQAVTIEANKNAIFYGTAQIGYVDPINQSMVLSWAGASTYGAIQTYSSSILALNPSGNNVAIGRTNAFNKLTIKTGTGNNLDFFDTGSAFGLGIQSVNDTNTGYKSIDYYASKHSFLNGNFLVGTSVDSGQKLQVQGNALFAASSGTVATFQSTTQTQINLVATTSTSDIGLRIDANSQAWSVGMNFFAGAGGKDFNIFDGTAARTPFKIYAATGGVNMRNLPTSSAGLVSGDLWNNAGVVNIIP